MGIGEAIVAGFKAIAAIFGFANRKTDLNNTPEMQEALKKEREQKEKEKDVKAIQEAIEKNRLDELRKRLSG